LSATAPSPSGGANVSSSPSAGPATRVEGTVQSVAADRLTLVGGPTLELAPTTRITRTDRATAADLKPGLFVAITAK